MRAGLALIVVCLATPALAQGEAPGPGAPPHQGQALFEDQCARCHGVGGDGGEGLAPALIGVFGRAVASQPGFPYSDALAAKGGTWTPESLDIYVGDPQTFAPGAAMDANAPDAGERRAIIDYLKTLK